MAHNLVGIGKPVSTLQSELRLAALVLLVVDFTFGIAFAKNVGRVRFVG